MANKLVNEGTGKEKSGTKSTYSRRDVGTENSKYKQNLLYCAHTMCNNGIWNKYNLASLVKIELVHHQNIHKLFMMFGHFFFLSMIRGVQVRGKS